MSRVHPVIVLSAWFCIVCNLVMLVLDVIGDHIVFAYSMIGRVIVLYVVMSVSLDFPQCVDVSDLRMFIVCLDLVRVFCMCLE